MDCGVGFVLFFFLRRRGLACWLVGDLGGKDRMGEFTQGWESWGGLGLGKRRTIFCPPGPLPLRKDSCISSSGGGFGREGIWVFLPLGACVVVKGAIFVAVGILVVRGAAVAVDVDNIGWRLAAIARGNPLLQRPKARGSNIFFVWYIWGR